LKQSMNQEKMKLELMRALYSALLYLLTPLVLLRLFWRARQLPGYFDNWSQRFAYLQVPPQYRHGIWIHAVSFGETQAAKPLVQGLREQYPEIPIVITNSTLTGAQLARQSWGEEVFCCFAPYDLPGVVGRFLHRIQPRLALFMETEIWPNQIHQLNRQGIPTVLINGRLSERSARGYQRVAALAKATLNEFSYVAVQNQEDAKRFEALGLCPQRVLVTGSIKSDVFIPASLLEAGRALRSDLGRHRPIVIAASTHEGEEEIVLDAFSQLTKMVAECLIILVPRHPERFAKVAQMVNQRGYKIHRRSDRHAIGTDCQVYLGDTMGDLILLYAAADVAFVGGSLVPVGGHNMLEPASLGVPVVLGPYTHNFARLSAEILKCGAAQTIHNADTLANAWRMLLQDPGKRDAMGQAAKQMVEDNRGALQRCMTLIHIIIEGEQN
jgi:3-deoxy-D-manno-octulosonic-acid transferase